MKYWILVIGFVISINISAQSSEADLFGDGEIWDQIPLIVEEKLDLSKLAGYGLPAFIIFALGLILSIITAHRSGLCNYLAYELVIVYYIFWLIFLPVTLYILIADRKFSKV